MKKTLLATALTAALALPAHADIRINGFANLVGGITSSDETLYGYDDNINFSQESLFALQASGNINERMSATVQILARGVDDYDPNFEWAYISYRATNSLTLSAGRFRLPLFKYSDSLDIGYSHHWVAVPQAVYDVPFNNIDGFRLDYSDFVGDWEVNLGSAFGTFENDVSGGVIKGDNTYMVNAEISNDWFSLRTVFGGTEGTFSQPVLDATIAQIASVNAGFADFLALDEDSATFIGAGFNIDRFSWFLSGEYTSIEIEDSYTPKDEAMFVTAGIRAGKWTPSLTYSVFEGDEVKGVKELAALGEPFVTLLTPAVLGINQQFAQKYDVATATVRYDYAANIALKLEYSKYSDDLDEQRDASLVRFAINYIF
jgi:hypothetical protein